jgi:TPR repeat protein
VLPCFPTQGFFLAQNDHDINRKGVAMDVETAKDWFQQAAEQGYEQAIEMLERLQRDSEE